MPEPAPQPPPNRTFSSQQDVTPIHGHEADPNWTGTDRAGHVHAMVDRAYPTLRVVSEHVACDPECCDGYDIDHYECVQCGERITPGTRRATYQMVGSTRYWVDGRPVSREEYDTELAAHYALVRQWQEYQQRRPAT